MEKEMAEPFSLADTLCDLHDIALQIAVEFPTLCGRLHMHADLLERLHLSKPLLAEMETEFKKMPVFVQRKSTRRPKAAKLIKPVVTRICPHCGRECKGQGFHRHVAACRARPSSDVTVAGD